MLKREETLKISGSVSRQSLALDDHDHDASLSLPLRSSEGPVRRTANRLKTTCVDSRGVVSGRAAKQSK